MFKKNFLICFLLAGTPLIFTPCTAMLDLTTASAKSQPETSSNVNHAATPLVQLASSTPQPAQIEALSPATRDTLNEAVKQRWEELNSQAKRKKYIRTAIKWGCGAAIIALSWRYGKRSIAQVKELFGLPTRVKAVQEQIKNLEKTAATRVQCEEIKKQGVAAHNILADLEKKAATKEQCESLKTLLAELEKTVAKKGDLKDLSRVCDIEKLAKRFDGIATKEDMRKLYNIILEITKITVARVY